MFAVYVICVEYDEGDIIDNASSLRTLISSFYNFPYIFFLISIHIIVIPTLKIYSFTVNKHIITYNATLETSNELYIFYTVKIDTS